MISSKALKDIVAEARPIIERQIDDALKIAAFREVVTAQGGDWSSLKALIKAQVQDEGDDGKRVEKILAKAEFATGYADMLGWSKMNENNFSADDEQFDPITGEFRENGYANAKLVETFAKGMQTEIGRKALAAGIDMMIAAEEAETESPRNAAEAVSERTATGQAAGIAFGLSENSPETATTQRVNGHSQQSGTVANSQNIEIDPIEDRQEVQSLDGNADANTGGDHEEVAQPPAAQAETIIIPRVSAKPGTIAIETDPSLPMKRSSFGHCFPEISNAAYSELRSSIITLGVQDPIIRKGDVILDGWCRYNIARSLGLEYPVEEYASDDELLDVIRWQRSARDWTPAQEAKVAKELAKELPDRAADIWAAFHISELSDGEVVAA